MWIIAPEALGENFADQTFVTSISYIKIINHNIEMAIYLGQTPLDCFDKIC